MSLVASNVTPTCVVRSHLNTPPCELKAARHVTNLMVRQIRRCWREPKSVSFAWSAMPICRNRQPARRRSSASYRRPFMICDRLAIAIARSATRRFTVVTWIETSCDDNEESDLAMALLGGEGTRHAATGAASGSDDAPSGSRCGTGTMGHRDTRFWLSLADRSCWKCKYVSQPGGSGGGAEVS
jgi:hypothetical protein